MSAELKPDGMINISWNHVIRVVVWLIPLLLAIGMLYLRSEFVTHQQMNSVMAPIPAMELRVERLEDFKVLHQQIGAENSKTLILIQQDIASMKAQISALKEQSTKEIDRNRQRLDELQRKD